MRKSIILTLLLFCLHIAARGQTISSLDEIDLSALPKAAKAKALRYWYDDDGGSTTTIDILSEREMLDVSGLIDGLHTLHLQLVDENGNLSDIQSSLFMKMSTGTDAVVTADKLMYWFDIEPVIHKVDISEGIQILDVSDMVEGLHTIHYQLQCSDNQTTSILSSLFLKVSLNMESAATKSIRYWFDDDATTVKVTDAVSDIQFLDVSALPVGLHTLHYQSIDDKGNLGAPVTGMFMKNYDKVIEEGQNRITKYQYWLNDNTEAVQTVSVDNDVTPFTLISLLPINSEPIRSSSFHFEIVEDVPTIYAKNELYIRFHDVVGSFIDDSKSFIDYSAKQVITDIELLESGIRSIVVKPDRNTIKWFKVEAVRGDSLTFKTDRACTLQLFSPAGEEIYSVNSPEVLQFGGAYAPEDGDYYVALHDVTTNTNDVTIDYQHIDKFAVLNYTPDTIGVATSFVEMRLDGNGYDKLENVFLTKGENTIAADSINIISKSSALLRFPLFGNEEQGDYDVQLDFNDDGATESLTINGGVTLSPVQMGDVEIRVTPSETIGYPYPVTISVTNTGNLGMLYVPFNIAATFDFSEFRANASIGDCAWSSMWPMNFELPAYNDSIGYSPYTLSYSLFGTGLPGMVLHGFIPALGPHETRDYIVGFVGSGHAKFLLYAWAGRPMNGIYEDDEGETNIYSVWKYLEKLNELSETPQNGSRVKRAPDYNGINTTLNVADHINENAAHTARTATGIGLAGGGIINGLRLRQIHQYDDDDFAREVLSDYREDLEQDMTNPGIIASIAGMPDLMAAFLGLQQQQAGCGNPMPDGHVIEILAPGDPNDITGYTSDAGSKFMKEGTTNLYYNIEFENDSTLANAAAHTIVVTDTLDATRFDLSSFRPTNVKVGKKTLKLSGEKSFTEKTIDLRPEIEVVAQVSLAYDEQKGIARWTIESLDPYSMESITDAYRGALPVNVDGNGMGELTFDIRLKPGMQDGDAVSNRAGIVFDQEGIIMTPTWTNIVDGVNPISRVENITLATDSTAVVQITASDERSKPWKYDLYRQNGIGTPWQREAVGIPADSSVVIIIENGINYGFYVVVTDSAGNVEQKNAVREYTLNLGGVIAGDVNGDGVMNLTDASWIVRYFVGRKPDGFVDEAVDVDGDGNINLSDAQKVVRIFVGKNN